jgi:uncharacterized membrane protein (UPF0127 family)
MVRNTHFSRAAVLAALFSFMPVLIVVPPSVSAQQPQFRKDKLTLKTSSGDHVIAIEVAETNEQKSLGLMFRTSVPPNTGMLFPYNDPQELTMWMRNTYASLDMVFIRRDGIVHRIEYGTEPLSERVISSKGPVTAVLELAAGEAKRLGVMAGDRVDHATFNPRKR